MRKSTRSRSTVQIAFALKAVTENINRKRGFVGLGIINDWPTIVGSRLANKTLPEKLTKNGTLRIRVDGPIATEIQHMEPQILDKVAVYFGYRAVHRLSIVQGPIEKQLTAVTSAKDPSSDSIQANSLPFTTACTKNTIVKSALSLLSDGTKKQGKDG